MSTRCAACGHALSNHGRWWYDDAYGPCRLRRCYCQGWIEQDGDCAHDPRLGEGDEVRCSKCGVTLRVIDG